MTQEEKDLLMKDLCARLPYGVKVKLNGRRETSNKLTIDWLYTYSRHVEDIKPYLRPMSSMTEEEVKEIQKINWQFCKFKNVEWYVGAADDGFCSVSQLADILEYLNKHHFDYRGLISIGLALPAKEGMYNTKQ